MCFNFFPLVNEEIVGSQSFIPLGWQLMDSSLMLCYLEQGAVSSSSSSGDPLGCQPGGFECLMDTLKKLPSSYKQRFQPWLVAVAVQEALFHL